MTRFARSAPQKPDVIAELKKLSFDLVEKHSDSETSKESFDYLYKLLESNCEYKHLVSLCEKALEHAEDQERTVLLRLKLLRAQILAQDFESAVALSAEILNSLQVLNEDTTHEALLLIGKAYADQPEMGTARPDLGSSYRVFHHKRWVVIYRPIQSGIEILRVVDGARDYPSLFP